jgi:FtsP/CotA-like multicopper oxidase with cupredoxin domain
VDGKIQIRGDWRETMSTHWFHDHMLDYTAQNVYKGNAVMMNYYSAIDRGNEVFEDGVNLRFPSGSALDWGNRDYDINLVIADKAWDQAGQLWFNIFNKDGFIGDQVLTNWLYKPYFEVRARRYRFRILNGAVSRYFSIALVRERQGNGGEFPGPDGSGVSYDRVRFHMIGNDGNIMEHAVPFDGSMDLDGDGDFDDHNGQLPTQAIAERYDIIVDFDANGIKAGDKIYFVNRLEHPNGKVTGKEIDLADILSEKYLPQMQDITADGIADQWIDGDPAVGKFLELRVVSHPGGDPSMNPADYEPGRQKMIPLKLDRDNPDDIAKLANVHHRTFLFGTSNGTDEKPWTIKTDGGSGFNMDPRRISAAPQLSTGPTQGGTPDSEGTWEVWTIDGGGNGWSHPVHVHFEEGIILNRGGAPPPEWEKWARKDMYRVGPLENDGNTVEIAIQFREFAGTYMEHCHNTQHEDNAMLLRYDIEHPGQLKLMPAPIPSWDGVEYVDSAALPTFRTGDGPQPTGSVAEVTLFESLGANPSEFIFTANALNGTAPYQYRFWLSGPSTNGWVITQPYSATNKWTFTTSGLASGTYSIQVDARSAGSTAEREADAFVSHIIPPVVVSGFTLIPQRTTYASNGVTGYADLFVNALPRAVLTLSGTGITPLVMTQDVPNTGRFFAHLQLGFTMPADLIIENSLEASPIPYPVTPVDEVNITQAIYDPTTKVLTVKAVSRDTMSPPVTLTVLAFAVAGNPAANTLDSTGTLAINLSSTIPPLTVQVVSSQGGTSTAKVSVVDSAAAPASSTAILRH